MLSQAPDANAMRLCIAISLQWKWGLTVVNVSTAFLNAKLSSVRTVYTKPPAICVHFGLAAPNEVWSLTKAPYGLKGSPTLWEDERDKKLKELVISHPKPGTLHLRRSIVHHSVWLVLQGARSLGLVPRPYRSHRVHASGITPRLRG